MPALKLDSTGNTDIESLGPGVARRVHPKSTCPFCGQEDIKPRHMKMCAMNPDRPIRGKRKSNKAHKASFHGQDAKHIEKRAPQTNSAVRNILTARWIIFLKKPENANKTLNLIRADFVGALFEEFGV